jgi:phosphoglycolate phosphatase-like HAD superfamily hydrolase
MIPPIDCLKSTKAIFWDFDGVIKDSVEAKSDAFEQLFLPFGEEIAKKVRTHHEENGGISRFDKLPKYIGWVEQEFSKELLNEYAEKFSLLVKQKVIDSEWVVGVLDYLKNNYKKQQFFLVTATPQKEMEEILSSLSIKSFFKEVIGSPTKKEDGVRLLLDRYLIAPDQAVMVGDSSSDYSAAIENKVPFVLRKTDLNVALQKKLNCEMTADFKNE